MSGAGRRRWTTDGIVLCLVFRVWCLVIGVPGPANHAERQAPDTKHETPNTRSEEMCGIAGAIDLEGRRSFSAGRLLAMTGAIAHRGPDDERIHLEPGLAMGARRLSIVDLAGGRQPIANEDGTIWVTQNGEIFEYPELQADLVAR